MRRLSESEFSGCLRSSDAFVVIFKFYLFSLKLLKSHANDIRTSHSYVYMVVTLLSR